jgi:hypothetical protein
MQRGSEPKINRLPLRRSRGTRTNRLALRNSRGRAGEKGRDEWARCTYTLVSSRGGMALVCVCVDAFLRRFQGLGRGRVVGCPAAPCQQKGEKNEGGRTPTARNWMSERWRPELLCLPPLLSGRPQHLAQKSCWSSSSGASLSSATSASRMWSSTSPKCSLMEPSKSDE